MKIFLTLLLCLSVTSVIAFAGKKRMTTDQWLVLRHSQLEKHAGITKIPRSKLNGPYPEEKDKRGYFTYHPARNGLIRFQDGSWVILTSNSVHKENGVGDITLVKTSTGKFYANRGHCCLTLMIRSESKITSLKVFLSSHGLGPNAEPTPWVEYTP